MRVRELKKTTVCPYEDLLRDILCISLIPHLLKGVGVDHILIFVHEHTKGVAITCECLGHYLFVG